MQKREWNVYHLLQIEPASTVDSHVVFEGIQIWREIGV